MRPRTPASTGARFRHVFGIPMLLALVSAVGLLSALLGDELWDVLSWLTLGGPVAIIAWSIARA